MTEGGGRGTKGAAVRIASGAVVGLGLGLIVSAIFPEYLVYAVVVGVALGAVLGALGKRGGGAS